MVPPIRLSCPNCDDGGRGGARGWFLKLYLGEERRTLFDRLSVFAGPVEYGAVLAICGDADALPDLVDRSLVVRHPGEPARFGMPETLRAFGHSRFAGDPGRDPSAADLVLLLEETLRTAAALDPDQQVHGRAPPLLARLLGYRTHLVAAGKPRPRGTPGSAGSGDRRESETRPRPPSRLLRPAADERCRIRRSRRALTRGRAVPTTRFQYSHTDW